MGNFLSPLRFSEIDLFGHRRQRRKERDLAKLRANPTVLPTTVLPEKYHHHQAPREPPSLDFVCTALRMPQSVWELVYWITLAALVVNIGLISLMLGKTVTNGYITELVEDGLDWVYSTRLFVFTASLFASNDLTTALPPSTARRPLAAPDLFMDSSFFQRTGVRLHDHTFCLVIGPEGTGSTWLSTVLPADHRPPVNRKVGITATLHQMWANSPMTGAQQARDRLVQDLRHLVPHPVAQQTLTVLHASVPDWDADHYPDLHSSLWPQFYQAGLNLRIIVTFRDPVQAAFSNYRRKWPHLRHGGPHGTPDLLRSARSTERHMTLLSNQLRTLPHPRDVLVLDYHQLMMHPEREGLRIAEFLWFASDATRTDRFLDKLRASRRAPSDYTSGLSKNDRRFLEQFFDAERRGKWDYLRERALEFALDA